MLVIFETVKFRIAIIAAFISCAPLIYANPVEAFWGNESRKILGTWECKSTIKANQLTIYTDGQYAFSNDGQLNANGLIVYSHSNGPRIKYRTNSRGKWSVSGSNMEITSTYMDSRNISNPPSDFKHGPWVWRAFLDDEFGHKDAYINSKGITTYLKILEINANNFVTRSSKGVLNTCTR